MKTKRVLVENLRVSSWFDSPFELCQCTNDVECVESGFHGEAVTKLDLIWRIYFADCKAIHQQGELGELNQIPMFFEFLREI